MIQISIWILDILTYLDIFVYFFYMSFYIYFLSTLNEVSSLINQLFINKLVSLLVILIVSKQLYVSHTKFLSTLGV